MPDPFICGACGERFEDRMDHIETCKGPFPSSWWNEGDGDVLWWCWRDGAWLGEAPYLGSPLDLGHTVEVHTHQRTGKDPAARILVGGWPGYHTHWTRLPPMPGPPNFLD
jgi:hypothetical protein